MALSPKTELAYSTLRDLKVPELPLELMSKVLAKAETAQLQHDKLMQLPVEYIKASKADRELAMNVMGWRRQVNEELKNTAMSGDARAYLSKLRQYGRELMTQYSPGGIIYGLAERYKQAAMAEQQIAEATKDNKNPLYKQYYEEQLRKQYDEEDIIDFSTGEFKSIVPPATYKEVVIWDEMEKMFKDYATEKNVDIRPFIDPITKRIRTDAWSQIIREFTRDEDFEKMLENFWRRPDIRHAIAIDYWDMTRRLDDSGKSMLIENARKVRDVKYNIKIAELDEQLNLLKKMGKDNREKVAKMSGYESYEEYKAAIERMKQQYENAKNEEVTYEDAALDAIKAQYEGIYVPKYQFTKEEMKLMWDRAALVRISAALRAAAARMYEDVVNTDITYVQDSASAKQKIDIIDTYTNLVTQIKSSIGTFRNRFKKLNEAVQEVTIQGPTGHRYAITHEDVVYLHYLLSTQYDNKTGKINRSNARSILLSSRYMDPGKVDNLLTRLENDSELRKDVFNWYAQIDKPIKAYFTAKRYIESVLENQDEEYLSKLFYQYVGPSGMTGHKKSLIVGLMTYLEDHWGEDSANKLLEDMRSNISWGDARSTKAVRGKIVSSQAAEDQHKFLLSTINRNLEKIILDNVEYYPIEDLQEAKLDIKGDMVTIDKKSINLDKSEIVFRPDIITGKYEPYVNLYIHPADKKRGRIYPMKIEEENARRAVQDYLVASAASIYDPLGDRIMDTQVFRNIAEVYTSSFDTNVNVPAIIGGINKLGEGGENYRWVGYFDVPMFTRPGQKIYFNTFVYMDPDSGTKYLVAAPSNVSRDVLFKVQGDDEKAGYKLDMSQIPGADKLIKMVEIMDSNVEDVANSIIALQTPYAEAQLITDLKSKVTKQKRTTSIPAQDWYIQEEGSIFEDLDEELEE
ncbi:MAG: hypothetical protein KatS3mg054_0001 [Chloroflexus sp.]|nr:MAG: hypothetical protein KatS3mg054_0001 [Chloroflexus sp.]